MLDSVIFRELEMILEHVAGDMFVAHACLYRYNIVKTLAGKELTLVSDAINLQMKR